MAVQSPARKTRGQFLDNSGFYEVGFAGSGEEFADLAEGEINDFGARFVDKGFRGTDHEFDVAAVRRGSIILSPLRGCFVLPGPMACAVGCILTPLRG